MLHSFFSRYILLLSLVSNKASYLQLWTKLVIEKNVFESLSTVPFTASKLFPSRTFYTSSSCFSLRFTSYRHNPKLHQQQQNILIILLTLMMRQKCGFALLCLSRNTCMTETKGSFLFFHRWNQRQKQQHQRVYSSSQCISFHLHEHVFHISLFHTFPPFAFDTLLNIYWGS